MKRAHRNSWRIASLPLALGVIGASWAPAAAAAPAGPVAAEGAVTIIVLHPLTGRPLKGVAVEILALGSGDDPAWVGITGSDGELVLFGLPDGIYEARVCGNGLSTREKFEIIFDLHPVVAIYFNPDLG